MGIIRAEWTVKDIDKFMGLSIQFSALFCAILLTFIISKVFNLRQEKQQRLIEIEVLSNKVTDLRRIANILINSHSLWPVGLSRQMNSTYAQLNYISYSLSDIKKGLEATYQNDMTINHTIGDLYLALRTIRGDMKDFGPILYDDYDHSYTYDYEKMSFWVYCDIANELWTSFDHEYNNINTLLNVDEIHEDDLDKIRKMSVRINPQKYTDTTLDIKKLLSSVGTDFNTLYLPQLANLLEQNLPIFPKTLLFNTVVMILMITTGVLIPMILQSLGCNIIYIYKGCFAIFILLVSLYLIWLTKVLSIELNINKTK